MRSSLSALAALALGLLVPLAVGVDGSGITASQETQGLYTLSEDAVTEHRAPTGHELDRAGDSDSLLHRSLLTRSEMYEGYKDLGPRKQTKLRPRSKPKLLPSDLKIKTSGHGEQYFKSRKIGSKKFHRRDPKALRSPPPVYGPRSSRSPPPVPHPANEPRTPPAPAPAPAPSPASVAAPASASAPAPEPAQKKPSSREVSGGHRIRSRPPPLRASRADAPSSSSSSDIAHQRSFLEPHNAARAKKSLPPLKWDRVLENYARRWGNHQRDRDNCNLVHSDGPYGENLFWGSGAPYNAGDAVWTWTNEEKYYNHATNSCAAGQMCGHYTQVVWKSTTHLGCATIKCKDSSIFIICSYNPPGNYIGERPY